MWVRERVLFLNARRRKKEKKGGGGWLDKERSIFEENMPTHQSQVVGFSTLKHTLESPRFGGFFPSFLFLKKIKK